MDGRVPRGDRQCRPNLALAAALLLGACSTGPNQATTWGSDQVNLRLAENGATVEFLASGGCYGSYGAIQHAVPAGAFTLSGTFTQLTGAYPGSVRYPAEYSGAVTGGTMTLTVSVPAVPLTLGPFQLRAGVQNSWPACLYP